METKGNMSLARNLAVVGLVVFSLAVIWQKMMGVTNYPTIPPAIILSIVAIGLYLFVRRLWAAVVAFLVPLSLFVGMLFNNWHLQLVNPEATGYPGIVLQWIALVVALIAGICAVVEERQQAKISTKN